MIQSPLFNNEEFRGPSSLSSSGKRYGKVTRVMIDDDPATLSLFGVPSGSYGAIKVRVVNGAMLLDSEIVAFPSNNEINRLPVKNEIVEIFTGPSYDASTPDGSFKTKYYYEKILNVWSINNHSVVPDINQTGSIFDGTFKENSKVPHFKRTEGDTLIPSRYGSFIRMGKSNVPGAFYNSQDENPVMIVGNNIPVSSSVGVLESFMQGGSFSFYGNNVDVQFNPGSINFKSRETSTENRKISNSVINTPSDIVDDSGEIQTTTTKLPTAVVPPPTVIQEEVIPIIPKKVEESFDDLAYVESVDDDDEDDEIVRYDFTDEVFKNYNVSTVNPADIKVILKDVFFTTYMIHQQGQKGFTEIASTAIKGATSASLPRQKKMFGKYQFPNLSYSNISRDFKQVYGNNFTPGNFLKYWHTRFNNNKSSYVNLKTKYDDIFQKYSKKYGVELWFVKRIASIESSFNPNLGNKKYFGLFQLSYEEFLRVYTSKDSIFDPEKNTDVGVKLLSEHLKITGQIVAKL